MVLEATGWPWVVLARMLVSKFRMLPKWMWLLVIAAVVVSNRSPTPVFTLAWKGVLDAGALTMLMRHSVMQGKPSIGTGRVGRRATAAPVCPGEVTTVPSSR